MISKLAAIIRARPEFVRKASVSFMLRFGGLFLQFLGSILVARLIGTESFGAFAYAMTWAIFAGMMLPLGLGELSIRELPGYMAKRDHGAMIGYFRALALTVILAALVVATLFAVLERTGVLVLAPGWKLVAAVALVQGAVLSTSHVLNGFQRILTSQFLETIVRQVLYLALVLGAVFVLGRMLSPAMLFEFTVIAALPVLAVMLVVLWRCWKAAGGTATAPQYQLRIWFIGAIPVLLTAFANRLQLDMDVLMVGTLLGDFEVGIYRAATRYAMLISIANMIALQLVGPMLSRALAEGQSDRAQALLGQAALVSFALGVPMVLVLALGAPLFLGLFGPDFTEASLALRLLLVGQTTIVLAGADAILLIMLRRERLVMVVTTIGVILNFVLNLALIGPFGIEGSAAAALLAMGFVRLTLVVIILRQTGFDPTILGPLRRWLGRRGGA